uniref:Uncharacterized protein n=1 Tax=Arundo donax TaxID=35708 RepID=A0A0A9G5S9_ARUDO
MRWRRRRSASLWLREAASALASMISFAVIRPSSACSVPSSPDTTLDPCGAAPPPPATP